MRPAAYLLAIAALAACDSFSAPEPPPDVAVALSRAVVRPDSSVTVTVIVTNAGSRAQQIQPRTCVAAAFEVLDASGAVVGPAGRFCNVIAIAPAPLTLGPGESVAFTDAWAGDLRVPGAVDLYRNAATGVYRIRGRVWSVTRGAYITSGAAEVRVER